MIPSSFFQYLGLIQATAARYGWDPTLLAAQIHQESAFNARAVSPCGAQGLAQFMPGTWKDYGKGDPFDPEAALDASVRLMKDLYKKFGDIRLALAAYNCGAGNVTKAAAKAGSPVWENLEAYLPSETRAYVPAILQKQSLYKTVQDLAQGAADTGKAALEIAPYVLLGLLGVVLLRRLL